MSNNDDEITPEQLREIQEKGNTTAASREKKALVHFNGFARTESGKITKSNYFRFLQHDLDDYTDLVFTEDQAKKIHSHLAKLSTGATAMTPMYCAGDRCQPGDELVRTTEGYVPIRDLDENIHKIWTWDKKAASIRNSGYNFKKFEREYTGNLHTIWTDQNESYSCTPEHLVVARWDEEAVRNGLFAVYLMEKNGRFRVGKTKLFVRDNGRFRFAPSIRARAEKADAVWLLGIFKTNTQALLKEEFYSVHWQIPKALFIATNHKVKIKYNGLYKWVTQEQLDDHHETLEKPREHYAKCLSSIGLSIDLPFWVAPHKRCPCTTNIPKFGFRNVFVIPACNVIQDYMAVPTVPEKVSRIGRRFPPNWKRIIMKSIKEFSGTVYSLDVDQHHSYVTTSGIITHNCPFRERCPLWQIGQAPVGRQCLIESELMKTWIMDYMTEYDVDPNNHTEVAYVNELAELQILEMRINMNLAKAENAELVTDNTIGIDREGDPIVQKTLSPFLEAKERLASRRSKIIKLMVGDRQEKYKKESALKVKLDDDPSSKMANMRAQIESMGRHLNSFQQNSSTQAKVLSPEDLMDSEDESGSK